MEESTCNSKNVPKKGTVGPRTERILGQKKTRSAQNRPDRGQSYIIKCKITKRFVQFEVRLIYYVYRSA